jgi:hypothetical protein
VDTALQGRHPELAPKYNREIPTTREAFLDMLRIATAALFATAVAVAPVYAGLDCVDESALKDIESLAKGQTTAEVLEQNYAWLCAEGAVAQNQRFRPRVEKACTKILDRDGDKSECVTLAAAAGFTVLGKHDIFDLVGKLVEDPLESSGASGFSRGMLYAHMADPRGAKILTDWWTVMIPRADAREKRHRSMAGWSSWRQYTAAALAKIGDADTATFLAEQAKATKDTHVRDACNAAAAEIRQRLAPK